ncbi:uncharacterized protein N7477_001781 [Penicillium maclennaniae]|uniref:uncharacterized protein n=1 Tax=Penicillium maclennaniae TaxID=1343394 RepID=UPI0025410C7C|nr:uncharacterized protein N7477_001781 [Penicillium maclennaniae]KAJ5681841.1 hypothetical protein N7477_001781 [Penicillium maclennaniae]
MHRPVMSLDSTIVHCRDEPLQKVPKAPPRSLRKSISIPAVSTLVKESWNWAGDTLNNYRDGLSAEQRRHRAEIETRKQVLYMKIKNVSTYQPVPGRRPHLQSYPSNHDRGLQAVSYEEWRSCAEELDVLEHNNAWKQEPECDEYYPRLVQERLRQLEEARISCDVSRMLFLVRTALSRDLGKMSNASLYRHSHIGTKDLIEQYIATALHTIKALVEMSDNRCDGLELKYILDQLLAARQAFGRSALLFSGGATFGMNHIGVLKALYEQNLIPRIISGASAGSIVCAVFCTCPDDDLPGLLDTYVHDGDFAVFNKHGQEENIFQKTARFLKHGSFLDISHLANTMRGWLGDMTFQEAYNRTRRILNICVSSAGMYELPRLLNYISAPNVLIWSAVAVSCSVPLVFKPFTLMAKDPKTGEAIPWNDLHRQYIDGSVDGDLPMTRLSEMFNVNHFIVSQVNPHVVPFLPKEDGPINPAEHRSFSVPAWVNTMTHLAKDEILHRMTVLSEMGVFPTSMTKAASIMNQKYSGDINIYPELSSSNFPRILENPTKEFMLEACLSGERATWPRLSRIHNACAIELALDRAIQQMRARVAFSPGPLTLRKVWDEDGFKGGAPIVTSLFEDDPEGTPKVSPCKNCARHAAPSLSNTPPLIFPDTISAPRVKAHHRRSSISFGGAFTTGSGSDDEEDNELTYTIRPGPPYHRASWEASSYGAESTHGILHSPVRSRRSSFSTHSPRSASSRRASPKQVYAPSAREISMALSPSSRHLLSMTPSVHLSSHDIVARKTRH